jgi:hypothetical protein
LNTYCEGRCAGLAWKDHGDWYGGNVLACQQAQARFEHQHPGQTAPQTPLQAKMGLRDHGAVRASNGRTQPIPLLGV